MRSKNKKMRGDEVSEFFRCCLRQSLCVALSFTFRVDNGSECEDGRSSLHTCILCAGRQSECDTFADFCLKFSFTAQKA